MTIHHDDLSPLEQRAVDRAKVLLRDELVDLMNRFGIGREHLPRLYGALRANGELEFRQWQAERARQDHEAASAALAAFEDMPPSGGFYMEDGKLVYDVVGRKGGEIVDRAFLRLLLRAFRNAAGDNAAGFEVSVAELEADVAGGSNRLNVDRRWLWLALLRFWTNDLGRSPAMRTNHYQGSADPSGPVIDFIMAASINAIHPGQRTPQAVRKFIQRAQKKGLL